MLPELLAGQFLSQVGHHPVRTSVNVTFPNGVERELDAVGIRPTATGIGCKIIEVKRKAASQHDLEGYIHRFAETVRLADANRSTIAELVGWPEPVQSVSGLFISMAKGVDMSDLARQFGIEFWHYDRFARELQAADFSDRHIDLLQESLLVWEADSKDG